MDIMCWQVDWFEVQRVARDLLSLHPDLHPLISMVQAPQRPGTHANVQRYILFVSLPDLEYTAKKVNNLHVIVMAQQLIIPIERDMVTDTYIRVDSTVSASRMRDLTGCANIDEKAMLLTVLVGDKLAFMANEKPLLPIGTQPPCSLPPCLPSRSPPPLILSHRPILD